MKNIVTLLALVLLFNGCSKESITPSYAPKTYEEESRGGEGTIELSLDIENLEVDEFGGEIGDVPIVGSVFQRLAGMFADISIDDENGTEVVIEPTYFDFPELAQVDFNYIKGVNLEKVHLRVANDDMDGVSLTFIKRIEVYLNIDPEAPEGGFDNDEAGNVGGVIRPSDEEDEIIKELTNKDEDSEDAFMRDRILLLTYDKNRDSLGCLAKCLDMRVQKVNWRKILKSARSFSIETKLVVDSVPKARIDLGGEIKFSIQVNPGF